MMERPKAFCYEDSIIIKQLEQERNEYSSAMMTEESLKNQAYAVVKRLEAENAKLSELFDAAGVDNNILHKRNTELEEENQKLLSLAYPDGPGGDAGLSCNRHREIVARIEAEVARLWSCIELECGSLELFMLNKKSRSSYLLAINLRLRKALEASDG